RFCLSDEDAIELARFALKIEEHYQRPMDIEWAKDGADGKIYILQARPETVKSRKSAEGQERFLLKQKSEVLASGRAIGHKIGAGIVRVVKDASEMGRIKPGDIIVTDMTGENHEEHPRSPPRLRLPGAAELGGRARPTGIRHQQHDRRACQGGARVSGPPRRPKTRGGACGPGLPGSARLFRGKAERRRC